MTGSLIEQLAARLEVSPADAAQALDDLVDEVRGQLSASGEAVVPGIGTFERRESGIDFRPDATFSDAANAPYAGFGAMSVGDGEALPFAAPDAEPAPEPSAGVAAAYGGIAEEEPEAEAEVEVEDHDVPDTSEEPPSLEDALEKEVPPVDEAPPIAPITADTPGDEFSREEPEAVDASAEDDSDHTNDLTEVAPAEEPVESATDADRPPEAAEDLAVDEAGAPDSEEDDTGSEGADKPPVLVEPEEVEAATEPVPEQPDEEAVPADEQAPVEPVAAHGSDEPPPGEAETAAPVAGADPRPEEAAAAIAGARAEDEKERGEEPVSRPAEPAPDRPPQHEDRERSRTGLWLTLALVLIVVLVGGYFAVQSLQEDTAPAEPPTVVQNEAPSEQAPAGETTAPAAEPEEEPAPAQTDESPPQDEAVEAPPEESAPPPDREIDRAAGGWTIIVASTTSEAEAQRELEQYRGALDGSVPVSVIETTSNGTTRYRVGVGQFDARSGALNLQEELGDQIPSDAWTLRL